MRRVVVLFAVLCAVLVEAVKENVLCPHFGSCDKCVEGEANVPCAWRWNSTAAPRYGTCIEKQGAQYLSTLPAYRRVRFYYNTTFCGEAEAMKRVTMIMANPACKQSTCEDCAEKMFHIPRVGGRYLHETTVWCAWSKVGDGGCLYFYEPGGPPKDGLIFKRRKCREEDDDDGGAQSHSGTSHPSPTASHHGHGPSHRKPGSSSGRGRSSSRGKPGLRGL